MVSGDMLSQDEIDALLNGGSPSSSGTTDTEDYLSSIEQDALGEIGNISFGSAATALSTLLNQKVEITTPTVSVVRRTELKDEFPIPHVAVQVTYTEGIEGANLLVIRKTDAQIIADLMLGGEGTNPSPDFGELQLSAVGEAMNQMMGSASTSMSTIFNKKVDISPPKIDFLDVESNTSLIPDEEILVKVSFRLKVGELIDSNIMQLIDAEFSKNLVHRLMNPEPIVEQEPAADYLPQEEKAVPAQPIIYHEEPVQRETRSMAAPSYQTQMRDVSVQPASFSDFGDFESHQSDTKNLDMLLDIPLQVTVELGRTKKTIKDILEMSQGSIVELDKLAGEPVDIFVNQKMIAKGEVVVIDENFGVRVTEILSQRDRLEKLK
ncbi:flagellar motor switch phosphatase FliY [Fictibacillus barbaricus]|uniref:Flagellar motor switch phosphatase FliY n=1 Tax=Fictibacillus barbaricus TaxID=182136 RepID=A0ABS2ZES5_9BACL|nr:flagellar motor switch phosphatase FliY [Fictibacillus barbaricus]MBN3545837.1 flagellar motor switch phosphatase FliY [Fictibacillus barbaricus]GGB56505.1 flagellar motor switch phosphatase FliY [Fictibacillus barbaricus]